jgi:predicted RNA-binding protein
MSLYKDKIRDHAIHAAVENVKPLDDFIKIKTNYKYILKELMYEMQREIDKIDNDLEL